MTQAIDAKQRQTIGNFDEHKRFTYLLEQAVLNNQLWLLIDEHGCMMLNTDDEDCVPVWPNEEFALLWATGEWENCKATTVSLNKWFSCWTTGLSDDELSIVAFPNQAQEGLVLYPDEFEFELKTKQKQQQKKR